MNILKEDTLLDVKKYFNVNGFIDLVTFDFSLQAGTDEFSWAATSNSNFSVKSCYNIISKTDSPFFWTIKIKTALAFLWDLKAPPRILIFGWCLIIKRLPSRDQLSKR